MTIEERSITFALPSGTSAETRGLVKEGTELGYQVGYSAGYAAGQRAFAEDPVLHANLLAALQELLDTAVRSVAAGGPVAAALLLPKVKRIVRENGQISSITETIG